MEYNKKFIKHNISYRTNEIKYLVIHDTGNKNKGANAEAHFNYFDGANRGSSADYFIDDTEVLQVVQDANYSWHCGDGRGKYGITNNNSIGLELCICEGVNHNKAYNNLLAITNYLMKKYKINIDNVVRHYDASRKSCPNTFRANNWSKWQKFKEDLVMIDELNKKIDTQNKALEKIEADMGKLKEMLPSFYEKGEKFTAEVQEWAKTPIENMKKRGISDGLHPEKLITRQEVITMNDNFMKIIDDLMKQELKK